MFVFLNTLFPIIYLDDNYVCRFITIENCVWSDAINKAIRICTNKVVADFMIGTW